MATLGEFASWFDTRRRLVAVVLVGWVALIAIGAGDQTATAASFATPVFRDVMEWLLITVAIICFFAFPFMIRGGGRPSRSRRVQSLRSFLGLVAFSILFATGFELRDFFDDVDAPALPSLQSVNNGEGLPGGVPRERSAVAALLVIGVASAATLLWTRRRLAAAADSGLSPTLEAEIAPALQLATEQLLAGSDPRMSVLAAYATLEKGLTDLDRGRQQFETAAEHLARVLVEVPVMAGPAVRLGELYEIARFSDHAVTPADQHEAALALDRARSKLGDFASVAS